MNRSLALVIGLVVAAALLYWQRASEDFTPPAAPQQAAAVVSPVPLVPLAREYSFDNAVNFIDKVSLEWTREKKCGTCHTNYPYLLARPLVKPTATAEKEVRVFFEDRFLEMEKDPNFTEAEVTALASFLALHDSRSGAPLSAVARRALDWMVKLQLKDGRFPWSYTRWPPMQIDNYYGTALAALSLASAPAGYRRTPQVASALAKVKEYLQTNAPPNLHHRMMVLWVSAHMQDLVTREEAAATIDAVSALQNDDGGWSLPSLGDWKRHDGTSNGGGEGQSDGYGTGFVLYVLHQAKVPRDDSRIRNGLQWLKTHQRENGNWFTRSLSNDKYHYITNAGTAFSVMALACYERGC